MPTLVIWQRLQAHGTLKSVQPQQPQGGGGGAICNYTRRPSPALACAWFMAICTMSGDMFCICRCI